MLKVKWLRRTKNKTLGERYTKCKFKGTEQDPQAAFPHSVKLIPSSVHEYIPGFIYKYKHYSMFQLNRLHNKKGYILNFLHTG